MVLNNRPFLHAKDDQWRAHAQCMHCQEEEMIMLAMQPFTRYLWIWAVRFLRHRCLDKTIHTTQAEEHIMSA